MAFLNVIRNFFKGPARDLIVAAAFERVKIKIQERGLSENDRILAESLLNTLQEEVQNELNKQ